MNTSNKDYMTTKNEVQRDGSGNILSDKRTHRRNLGWPSGRQWRKYRKALRRAIKDAQTA